MQKEGKTPPPRVDILDETLKFMQAKFAGQPHVIEQFMKVYNYYANIRGRYPGRRLRRIWRDANQ